MCANITEHAALYGCARAGAGWIPVDSAHISYDHPLHANLEHALNIDFVNDAAGFGSRVAVELSLDAAEALAQAILTATARARAYEAGG